MSTIRTRVAALGLATLTAASGIALAGGPALAATTSPQSASAQTAAAQPQSATQVSAVTYADQTVRAWGAGNHAVVASHTTSSVAKYLWSHTTSHMNHWARTGAEGAAGTVYVTYRNTVNGHRLVLGVSNIVLGDGGTHAVHSARVS